MQELMERARELVRGCGNILVFSGAGLSTESGIPDFRSPGGVWERYDPSDFYFDKIVSDENSRKKYWKMSSEMYSGMKEALPNAAHKALKELEEQGRLAAIVTQNIDNLHQKAGNSNEKVIELHGSAFSVTCLSCGASYKRDMIEERLRNGEDAPRCDKCSGILKPATISFGQSMPDEKMTRAMVLASECDLCIVLGSSLVVYPAASVPEYAVQAGSRLLIVNREPTHLDPRADMVINDSVTFVVPFIVKP